MTSTAGGTSRTMIRLNLSKGEALNHGGNAGSMSGRRQHHSSPVSCFSTRHCTKPPSATHRSKPPFSLSYSSMPSGGGGSCRPAALSSKNSSNGLTVHFCPPFEGGPEVCALQLHHRGFEPMPIRSGGRSWPASSCTFKQCTVGQTLCKTATKVDALQGLCGIS